jgi:hypothetical protein
MQNLHRIFAAAWLFNAFCIEGFVVDMPRMSQANGALTSALYSRTRRRTVILHTDSSSSNNKNDDTAATANNNNNERKEMEELILSLSHDSSDEHRRERLACLFAANLSTDDSFAGRFNAALIDIGEQVRTEAATQAARQESIAEVLPSFPLSGQERSSAQLQLWALIDMMVQSKTIVKRASGDLGSQSTFG